MLIRGFRARNFMKFKELALDDIPREGLLGIEGRNEGGKSTLGELVQFALFGKTLSSQSASVAELINWDADDCSVELDFEIGEGPHRGEYRVYRQIDRYGTNYARLVQSSDKRELATGLMRVRDLMRDLIRFDFEDFTHSFFLAEKEFPRSPTEMRSFLDRMVGVDVLLEVGEEVKREIGKEEEEFAKLAAEMGRNDKQIEKYVPNISKIPEVEAVRDKHQRVSDELREKQRELETQLDRLSDRIKTRDAHRNRLRQLPDKPASRLQEGVDHLLEAYPSGSADEVLKSSSRDLEKLRGRLLEIQKLGPRYEGVREATTRAKRELSALIDGDSETAYPSRLENLSNSSRDVGRRRSKLSYLGLTLLVAGLGFCGAGLGLLQGWLEYKVGPFDSSSLALVGIGFGLFLIAIAFWAYVKSIALKGEDRRLLEELEKVKGLRDQDQKRREQLDNLALESVKVEELPKVADQTDVDEVKREVAEYDKQLNSVCRDDSLEELCRSLADDESRILQRLRSTVKEIEKEIEATGENLKRETSRRDRAETEIAEYRKQEGRKAALEEKNKEIKELSDRNRANIEERELLLTLLNETVESIRHRAGPNLGKTLRRLLPSLTGGRYKDLKITSDFELQVFTSEKSDFLSQHELSGGTFEGLSLGFRLAFSQAFIQAVVQGSQFLFLDEPFKAMDVDRVHRSLSSLIKLSPELKQIFVIIPGIKEHDRELFDRIYSVTVGDPLLDREKAEKSQAGLNRPESPESQSVDNPDSKPAETRLAGSVNGPVESVDDSPQSREPLQFRTAEPSESSDISGH